MRASSCEFQGGRAVTAAQLHSLKRVLRQLKFQWRSIESRTAAKRSRCFQVPRQSIDSAIREAAVACEIELSMEGVSLLSKSAQEAGLINSVGQAKPVVHQARHACV